METILIVNLVLMWIVILFTLLLALALVRRVNRQATRKANPISLPRLEKGEQAPEFSAPTLSGETVTLANYAGRKVAFLFVAAHCGPCRELLPQIRPLAPTIAEVGVDLVLVSNSNADQTRALVEELDLPFPVLVAPSKENTFLKDYKATSTPSYCLLNEQGIVESAGHPSMEWGEWKELTDSWTKRALASSKKGG